MTCGLPVAAPLEAPNEVDCVPAAGAPGEAVPQIALRADDEGARIVAAVNRAWANEPVRSTSEADAPHGEDLFDGDEA